MDVDTSEKDAVENSSPSTVRQAIPVMDYGINSPRFAIVNHRQSTIAMSSVAAVTLLHFTFKLDFFNFLLVVFVWLASGWYVVARVCESRVAGIFKFFLCVFGMGAALISPFVFSRRLESPSVWSDIWRYGWNGWYVSEDDHWLVFAFGLCVMFFSLVQLSARSWHGGRRV